jgi:hypothetical protein
MKKTYKHPDMKVVKIQTQKFLAESTTLGIGGNYSGGDVQSRGFSDDFLDDED